MLRALLAAAGSAVVLAGQPFDAETRQGTLTGGPGTVRRLLLTVALARLFAVGHEGYRFLRLTPRRIEIDDGRLRLRFSARSERVVALDEVRGGVGIVDDHGEALRPLRRTAPRERRRNVLALAGEAGRDHRRARTRRRTGSG